MIESAKINIFQKLRAHPKRLKHVLGVYETAIKLAKIYDVDLVRVGVAALYHDFAKYDKLKNQIMLLDKSIIIKYQETPVIYHAYASAQAYKNDFNSNDEDILNAIRFHVWGRKNMTIIEKIIFVSDACEPNRKNQEAPIIFKLAVKNLDHAVELSMKVGISYLEQKKIVPSKEQMNICQYYKELNSG